MGLVGRRASGFLVAAILGGVALLGLLAPATASVTLPSIASAVLESPHSDRGVDTDSPTNGRYDWLEVDVVVNVTTSGVYVVEGVLKSGDGTVTITEDNAGFSLNPGLRVVPLSFSGYAIINRGRDGPYRVDLALLDSTFSQIDTGTHATASYGVTDFDPPPATFDPPHADAGRDTDAPPNGRYDELLVGVRLEVAVAGAYILDADLYTLAGPFVTSEFLSVSLQPGAATLEVALSGMEIRFSGLNGPYRVVMTLYDGSSFAYVDNDTHATTAYQATDFDGPAVAFSPPHTDFGLDADSPPDVPYDWLVIRVSLQANEGGAFLLWGTLSDQFGFVAEAQSVANLTMGLQAMDLKFPGPYIRDLEANGPYFVQMYASKFNEQFVAAATYVTGPYSHTQFASPSGFISGPHTDEGIDTSVPGDGLYDWLAVDVGVNTTRAGAFEVEVFLIDYFTSNLVAGGSTRPVLTAGLFAVRVLVDGHAIAASGSPGPYLAFIELWDRHGVLIDSEVYFTRGYLPTEFQPIDATPATGVARLPGAYWRNARTFPVDYTVSDPTPSDGVGSVTLYYRFSADNVTFGPWTPYREQSFSSEGTAVASGAFTFDAPAGEGFYQFAIRSTDAAGNVEAEPVAAEAIAGVFVPSRLEISPATVALVADVPARFEARVLNGAGRRVPMEAPIAVRLLSSSAGGAFRSGTVPLSEIVIPGGSSTVSFDYVDSVAGTVLIVASADGVASGMATIVVQPSNPLGTPLAQGLTGGGVVGLVAGVAIGWFLWRRTRKPGPPPEPPVPPPS